MRAVRPALSRCTHGKLDRLDDQQHNRDEQIRPKRQRGIQRTCRPSFDATGDSHNAMFHR